MSTTESQSIPNPEESPIGLDLDGLSFTMPKIGEREITTTISFSFRSLLAVMESRAEMADGKTAGLIVSFVGANSIAGYIASVKISELFYMALADMLGAIGDVDMKTADRALSDAQRDPTKLGKHRHRMMAEKSLRDAYEKFQSAIDSRREKWTNRKLGYGDTQVRAEHGKAAIAASTISLILKMEALQPGVTHGLTMLGSILMLSTR